MAILFERRDFAGDASTVGAMRSGDVLSGRLSPGTDTDWIEVTLRDGYGYKALLDSEIEGLGLRLRTAEGRAEAGVSRVLDGGKGFTLDPVAEGERNPGGTYFLEVWSLRDDGAGEYSLSFTEEPADGPESLTTLAPGPAQMVTIDYGFDADWLAIDVEAGRGYGVVFSTNGPSFNFDLRRADGGSLSREFLLTPNIDVILDGVSTYAVPYDAAEDGTIFARVAGRGGSGQQTGPVFVQVIEEETNLPAFAPEITLGHTVEVSLDYDNDRDRFAVTLEADTPYRITLEDRAGELNSGALANLYGPSGSFLRQNPLLPEGGKAPSYVFESGLSGRFTIMVSDGADEGEILRLTVEEVAPSDVAPPPAPGDPLDALEGIALLVQGDLGVTAPDQLDGATVAVVTGGAVEQGLDAFFRESAFAYAPVPAATEAEAIRLFETGAADVLALPEGAVTPALLAGLDGAVLISGSAPSDPSAGGPPEPEPAADGQRVDGTASSNVLEGGAGPDILVGFGGADRMTGGAGEDIFALTGPASAPPRVQVTDWEPGRDLLAIDDLLLGLGGAGIDPRGLDAGTAFGLLGSGRATYQPGAARLLLDSDGDGRFDAGVDLGTDVSLALSDVLLF